MTEWNDMKLLEPDASCEYATFEALLENMENPGLIPGWNVDNNTTILVCQLSQFNWRAHIWRRPDIRERIKDLLDLPLNIIIDL